MVAERHDLAGLATDDRGGFGLPTSTGTTSRRLHRCRRGNISILVLIMGLVFYAMAAMVWNTGKVTSAKIEAQTAADAAAYSSAVWMSRAMNVTTGTNMLILRHSTAITAALSPALVLTWLPPVMWAIRVATDCASAFVPPFVGVAKCLATLAQVIQEVISWGAFMVQWGLGMTGLPDIIAGMIDLWTYQLDWVNNICSNAIEEQRLALQEYYDCEIRIARGDGTYPIRPPLHRGNPLTFLIPYGARCYQESWASDDSWHNNAFVRPGPTPPFGITIGRGVLAWRIGFVVTFFINWPATGFLHHIPSSQPQWSPLEIGPAARELVDANAWRPFTVIATAQKRDSNATSRQPPRQPLTFMAPGFFKEPAAPAAYAQAETYNPIDAHLLGRFLPHPWRVWTPWGWQWQARLSHGDPSRFMNVPSSRDSLVPGVATTTNIFSDLGVRITSETDVSNVTTH
ncbi:MAG: pilus assembly protein TadG-related protein [Planctomycetota bacterium]